MQHLNATACAQPSSLEGEWELRDCGSKHLVPVKVAWNGIFSRLEITGAEHDVSVQVCHPSNASLPMRALWHAGLWPHAWRCETP